MADNIFNLTEAFELLDDEDVQPIIKDSFKGERYSGAQLFNQLEEEIPKLADPIFPKVGVVSLVGSSDTGKSTLLRQLAISVALGLDDFVGYKLNPSSRNVICISTEDAISDLKQ